MREFSKHIEKLIGVTYNPNNDNNSNEKPFEDDKNMLKGFV